MLLFQAKISRPLDKYGMFWTTGRVGQAVIATCPEGEGSPGKLFCWESTGRGAACALKEAIVRAEESSKREGRPYRLVSINFVPEKGLKYLVEWVSG